MLFVYLCSSVAGDYLQKLDDPNNKDTDYLAIVVTLALTVACMVLLLGFMKLELR